MRDLTKSALSLSWAMPLFLTQQLAGLVTGLGSALDSGGWMRAASGLFERPAEAFRFYLPGREGSVARRELCNKVEVYLLVTGAYELTGVPAAPPFSLNALVDRAFSLGPFAALWALEGLGLEYAAGAWIDGPSRGLLADERSAALQVRSLAMLHAGMGMAFAQRTLEPLHSDASAAEICRAAREVTSLCRENSRPGYLGAALESIGLATRTLHPRIVHRFDEALWEIDREAVSYFWHGVGRAIYFLPVNFLPCGSSLRRAFEMAEEEAPHEPARVNIIAGLAWAFTLVNQRHPEVMENLLRNCGPHLASDAAFSDGVAASTLLRHVTTPDAPFVVSFCQHRPAPPDTALTALWEDLVRLPCREALQLSPSVLKTGLGTIFHYRGASIGGRR
jgi:hypothetical protein